MTDLSTTPTAEIVARVLDLHEKATPGEWWVEHEEAVKVRDTADGVVAMLLHLAGRHGVLGRRDPKVVSANAALIAYYRTACVELAKRCLHAEAVAAKSREEALEEAQQRLRTMQKTLRDLDINPAYCDGIKNAADFLEPLKSSRTDSGRSPATMPDVPLDET